MASISTESRFRLASASTKHRDQQIYAGSKLSIAAGMETHTIKQVTESAGGCCMGTVFNSLRDSRRPDPDPDLTSIFARDMCSTGSRPSRKSIATK